MAVQSLQGANWQRGGGKGKPPSIITRPDDRPPRVGSHSELVARRKAQDAELARRRKRRQKQKGNACA